MAKDLGLAVDAASGDLAVTAASAQLAREAAQVASGADYSVMTTHAADGR